MEIRVLRYFLEIAREGNMSRAAERLHVTQPTLSKQMKDLEHLYWLCRILSCKVSCPCCKKVKQHLSQYSLSCYQR